MTHDSQWKHEAGWRDMEFADKLPEGRKPLTWADLGIGPQSTWEGEAKALRARVAELEAEKDQLKDALAFVVDAVGWASDDELEARAALKQEGE